MRALAAVAVTCVLAGTAAADPPFEVQADLGLAVIGAGVEHAISPQLALAGEAFITSTYFLDWFGLGPRTDGYGVGARATWLQHPGGAGLYGVGFLRVSDVHTEMGPSTWGFSPGLAAGWAFPVGKRLDIRLGVGVVYFHYATDVFADHVNSAFVQLDAVVGYRL